MHRLRLHGTFVFLFISRGEAETQRSRRHVASREHSHGVAGTEVITYSLTPYTRVLLARVTGFQLVKKFTAFYEIRRFITAFTSARHLSLS